jgi:hypothetical protein
VFGQHAGYLPIDVGASTRSLRSGFAAFLIELRGRHKVIGFRKSSQAISLLLLGKRRGTHYDFTVAAAGIALPAKIPRDLSGKWAGRSGFINRSGGYKIPLTLAREVQSS